VPIATVAVKQPRKSVDAASGDERLLFHETPRARDRIRPFETLCPSVTPAASRDTDRACSALFPRPNERANLLRRSCMRAMLPRPRIGDT
jgi:hypothetical protein